MNRSPIEPNAFQCPPVQLWGERWLLLTAGELAPRAFNCMTVAWGGFGMLWAKPLAMVAVRPSRYTYEFMERVADFTLSAFPPAMKDKLTVCGTKSGRDMDKVKACGLHPVASAKVGTPGFEEAELILECRKLYVSDLNPDAFLSRDIEPLYNGRDYHRLYFAEVVAISGTDAYRRPTA